MTDGQPAAVAPDPEPGSLRRNVMAISSALDRWGYLRKWLVLGTIIGISAGIGAIVFYLALRFGTYLLLGVIGGYHVPTPVGEGGSAGSAGFSRPWAIPLTAGLGGLLAGLVVFGLAPEAEGHGTDSAIDAFHHNPKGIRARVSAVKIVASALTIGSGGSGGREGPTGQISAGFASLLGRWTGLSTKTTRIAIAAGIGSGIGAIFSAPIGGTVLGSEILYTEDFEAEALIPSLVASAVAFAIFGGYVGYVTLFGSHESFGFHPTDIGYYLLVGALGGLLGRAYATGFYGTAKIFHRLALPRALKPALAGLAVGALGLEMPEVLGTGYGWVQRSMGPSLMLIPLWIVLVVPLARIGATAFSIGSGGSGGIFGPGMVIGAFTGASVWRVALALGLPVPHEAAPFVIVGMVACFGSISHAPIAVLLMVTEMTGSLHLILASMLALAVAVAIAGRENIYRAQLVDRAASPAHRQSTAGPASATVSVGELMAQPQLVVDVDAEPQSVLGELRDADLPVAPVTDGSGRYCGVVSQQDLAGFARKKHDATLRDALRDSVVPTLTANLGFDAAVGAVSRGNLGWAPVLDGQAVLVGLVSSQDLLRGYRMALRRSVESGLGETRALPAEAMAVEEMTAEEHSDASGKTIGQLALPLGTVILTLRRGEEVVLPTASTTIAAGDQLGMLVHFDQVVGLRQVLSASKEQSKVDNGRGLSAGGLI